MSDAALIKALTQYLSLALEKARLEKGGPGSGHWGHAGRPGSRGGSVSGATAMSIRTGRTARERQAAAKKAGAGGGLHTKETAKRLSDTMVDRAERYGHAKLPMTPLGMDIEGLPSVTKGYGNLEGKLVVQWDTIGKKPFEADPNLAAFSSSKEARKKVSELIFNSRVTHGDGERSRARWEQRLNNYLMSEQ